MKWLLIMAVWSSPTPQDDFRFLTNVFSSKADCMNAVQIIYVKAAEEGIQAQGVCMSQDDLNLKPYY